MEIKLEYGRAPVYCKYRGQELPQPAYLQLDLRGEPELTAGYNPEIGNAVPMYVWEGKALRWPLSPYTSRESLESLNSHEHFQTAVKEIIDGVDVEANKHYIHLVLADLDVISVYDAVEYVTKEVDVTLAKLNELGFDGLLEEIEPDIDVVIDGVLHNALKKRLNELFKEEVTRVMSVEYFEDIEKIIFIVEHTDGRQRSLGVDTWGRTGDGLNELITKKAGELCLEAAKAAGITS